MGTSGAHVLKTLIGGQFRMLRNALASAVRNSPIRVVTIILCILAVWYGVYRVFLLTFHQLNLQETYGGHAIHFLLLLFFMALTVMLFFSNAIILYGGLTRSREMDFLLAAPVPTSAVFLFKYIEASVYASWALLLLALPLLAAFTTAGGLPPMFLPIFLIFLLVFIPIPAAAGAMAALLVGRFAPKHPGRVLAGVLAVAAIGLIWWLITLVRLGPGAVGNPWHALDRIFDKLRLIDNPVMPGYWLTRGLEHASNCTEIWDFNFREASFYFGVTVVNGLFLNTWAVVLGTRVLRPMVAAATARSGKAKSSRGVLDRVVGAVFAFLPRSWRLLIAKDLRLFFRDATQWSQCLIFLLLLAMYMFNVPRLNEYVPQLRDAPAVPAPRGPLLLAGMNTVAAGLITAVFTSRFIFPMLSLEGKRIWALGTTPLTRTGLVLAKFFYSVLLCGGVAVALVLLGSLRLKLSAEAGAFSALTAVCMCLGLSAIAVGSGAKWPNFREENAAKIAGGFGGTLNLLISLGFLVALIVPPGLLVGERLVNPTPESGSAVVWQAGAFVVIFTAITVAAFLRMGVRSFSKWEP